MTTDKIILTQRGPLLAKYGAAGVARVDAALAALVKADARRGLSTAIYALDDAQQLAPLGAKAVARPDNARAVKAAVDKLCLRLSPHYVVLLGSGDVVPFVQLANPAHGGEGGDDDVTVPSDLPYACRAAYSTDPSRFMGPTRVVGRIPDVPGATRPTLLVKLIRAAAAARTLPRADYQGYFGLSTKVWAHSTALSLRNTFGDDAALRLSPTAGPAWTQAQLAPRLHFINCHGADVAPEYYGQDGDDYPVAHEARRLKAHISKGTVMAAECCYGAQLYDPADAGGRQGIALTYLDQGACAVFGSTTIAYGPSEGNGSADLITQFFLQQVLAGASLGRAVLEARLQFAGQRTHLDPFDLKTLAQFYLLGDPSHQPVAPQAHALTRTKAFRQVFAPGDDRTVRGLRRERLERQGHHLGQALPRLAASDKAPHRAVTASLDALALESGLSTGTRLSFDLEPADAPTTRRTRRQVHVISAKALGTDVPAHPNGVKPVRAIVATVEAGRILHLRRLHSR
ncbi:MAG: hypothetical protein RL375_691 [Pseudomonadota bacterium]|jgi:hypothetical protein